MKWLSDATLAHLCKVADWPDLSGTRYELVEKIGQGGMGTVFSARDRELDRLVALKILNAVPDNPEAMARTVREAHITARLEHPSIVPIHDAGLLSDGRFYYAMKLVRGQRWDEAVKPTMPLQERLQLFQKVCDAVAFAHAHSVVHRDLKPQNLMLGPFGEVLVMDWGVAKEIGDGQRPADEATGVILGTPGYMAPEQARGEAELIDERADVHALGAILYFLLCGQAPVHDHRAASGANAVTPPRQFDPSIPRPLEAVCLKALAPDRAKRYGSAEALAADVADFLDRRRVQAYPEGIFEATLRLGMKYRTVLCLLLAYLIVRILLLVFLRS